MCQTKCNHEIFFISYYIVTHHGSGNLAAGGDDVKTRGDYVSRLIFQHEALSAVFGRVFHDEALSAVFGRITKWPASPHSILPLLFLKSFLKADLGKGQTDGTDGTQTDEMLNWGEPACPNDPPQMVGGSKKGCFISRPAALIT